jgi:ABC-type nickel/cobalt efflux system permease component RcnA
VFCTLAVVQVLVVIGVLWMIRSFYRVGSWVEVLEATSLLLVLATAFYVAWLQRTREAQVATRQAFEQELLRERNTLEQRVNKRTAELLTEVEEQRRAEQLNCGRNQVLEMLARDEPTDKFWKPWLKRWPSTARLGAAHCTCSKARLSDWQRSLACPRPWREDWTVS